jgi:hypothetical protein
MSQLSTGPAENPNLPTNSFIKSHTGLFGGEVLIYGLSREQAVAIQEFAADNGLEQLQLANPALDDYSKQRLVANGEIFPDDSVELSLGHTTDCHKALYEALGIVSS